MIHPYIEEVIYLLMSITCQGFIESGMRARKYRNACIYESPGLKL